MKGGLLEVIIAGFLSLRGGRVCVCMEVERSMGFTGYGCV